jgi:hypothetical protein
MSQESIEVPLLTLKFIVSQDEFNEAFSLAKTNRKPSVLRLGVVCLLLAAAAAAFHHRYSVIAFILGMGSGYIGIITLLLLWARTKQKGSYAQSQFGLAEITLELTDKGCKSDLPGARGEMDWSYFSEWKETGLTFVIRRFDVPIRIIPKRALGDAEQIAWLRSFLAAHISSSQRPPPLPSVRKKKMWIYIILIALLVLTSPLGVSMIFDFATDVWDYSNPWQPAVQQLEKIHPSQMRLQTVLDYNYDYQKGNYIVHQERSYILFPSVLTEKKQFTFKGNGTVATMSTDAVTDGQLWALAGEYVFGIIWVGLLFLLAGSFVRAIRMRRRLNA